VQGEPSVAVTPGGNFHVVIRNLIADASYGAAWMLVVRKDQDLGEWHGLGGVWGADLVCAADESGETIRVAGIDTYEGVWAGEGSYSGDWFGWGFKTGIVQRLSAAQVNGRFTLFAVDQFDGAYRLNLEQDEWTGTHGLAMGRPAATRR